MKKLFILILALTLSASINASAEQTRPTSKREQRKIKKQTEIKTALEILQSGQFYVKGPVTDDNRDHPYGGLACNLNTQDTKYKIESEDLDTTKSIYTLIYHYNQEINPEDYTEIIYNFKTGHLKINTSDATKNPEYEGNHTGIFPLGKLRTNY